MIRFQQVSKAYRGGRQALQKVDFHLKPADMAFLTGHSGAGKSTLLKLICALERQVTARFGSMVTILLDYLISKFHFCAVILVLFFKIISC